MKFVVQRVNNAKVTIDGKVNGAINRGLLVLVGVKDADSKEVADKMIKKLVGLRIFEDDNGKTNLSLQDVGGGILFVSQFTLLADVRRGNRPSFVGAGDPKEAEKLYDYMVLKLKESVADVQTGEFGADMVVNLENNGPFTIVMDSEELGY